MEYRGVRILPQVLAKPSDALPLDHVVAVDELLDAFDGRSVTSNDNFGVRRVLAA